MNITSTTRVNELQPKKAIQTMYQRRKNQQNHQSLQKRIHHPLIKKKMKNQKQEHFTDNEREREHTTRENRQNLQPRREDQKGEIGFLSYDPKMATKSEAPKKIEG